MFTGLTNLMLLIAFGTSYLIFYCGPSLHRELLVTFLSSCRDGTGYSNLLAKDLILCEFYDYKVSLTSNEIKMFQSYFLICDDTFT